jgi:hypothetical protein
LATHTHIQRHIAIAFIAIVGLILPVLGPAVDHHFFERFAFHSHVYLGDPDLDHGHVGDVSSGDTNSESNTYVATPGDGPSTGNIVFLANGPTNIDSLIELEDGFVGRSDEEIGRPREIVTALPEKPPRPDSPATLESVDHLGIG